MHIPVHLTPILLFLVLLMSCQSTPSSKTTDQEPALIASVYQEQHRPQFHFTPPSQWMNDPNGMFFYEGEYHLFYQHYPDSNVWGPMHWGHAISTDLIRWEQLPIAIYPDSLGYIFSGSAVVDWNNSSGLGHNGQPPLVAIYTYHDPEGERTGQTDFQYQGIAYSHDKGRSWQKYSANPVIPNPMGLKDFRDPKVIWHEASGQWVMALAVKDHIAFWNSSDLIHWQHLSDFGKDLGVHAGVWECPDLFPLQVQGEEQDKWVLLVSINPGAPNGGSGTQYFVGDFDGETFRVDSGFEAEVQDEQGIFLDYGRDNYAGVTWSDIPEEDGRRLFLGWMSNWHYANQVPTEVWRSAMTLPRTLELKTYDQSYRLYSYPVEEVSSLRSAPIAIGKNELDQDLDLSQSIGLEGPQVELILNFEMEKAGSVDFGIELSNDQGESYRIGYNAQAGAYYSDREKAGNHDFSDKFFQEVHFAPRLARTNQLSLHLIIDVASVELFADQGGTALTDIFFPSEDFNHIKIYRKEGKVKLLSGEAYSLKSIW